MLSPDSLQAFIHAADLGSFSAAARRMKKAQSAVSTAISNLEIDTGVQLFDRSTRSPTLTEAGRSLLPHARGILLGQKELMAKATSMAEDVEDTLCLAIEQGLHTKPILGVLDAFSEEFAHVSLELLGPGPNDTASLLKEGRAHLGVMTEQENYPVGFQFRGVGHTALVTVCDKAHPLASLPSVTYRDLRQHRQLMLRSRALTSAKVIGAPISASLWHAENPAMILDLAKQGVGWAELPLPVVRRALHTGDLVRLKLSFQQSDDLAGIDVVWTERHALGVAGQWLRDQFLDLPQDVWRGAQKT